MAEAGEIAAFSYKPLYLQVKDSLVRRLIDGVWQPGQLIPSEMELAREVGVSQGTIRKALDDARRAKQELEGIHAESAKLLAQARSEAAEIVSRSRSDADRFREEMKDKARAEATSMLRNAERQIELETTRALQQIRQERRPDSRYASAQQCAFEVRAAEQLFERNGIPYLETTDTSIEEIASRVLERLAIPRRVRP